jgi:hypothetical protein
MIGGCSFKKRDIDLISPISGLLEGSFSSIIESRAFKLSETFLPFSGKFN